MELASESNKSADNAGRVLLAQCGREPKTKRKRPGQTGGSSSQSTKTDHTERSVGENDRKNLQVVTVEDHPGPYEDRGTWLSLKTRARAAPPQITSRDRKGNGRTRGTCHRGGTRAEKHRAVYRGATAKVHIGRHFGGEWSRKDRMAPGH